MPIATILITGGCTVEALGSTYASYPHAFKLTAAEVSKVEGASPRRGSVTAATPRTVYIMAAASNKEKARVAMGESAESLSSLFQHSSAREEK